jgi:CheY-like chemotaxis protein
VSLLGRLEDLSLTDIIQIVYLSRRTGVLEIVDDRGRHTVLFRHGLIVNASSPEHPDLISWLEQTSAIPAGAGQTLRQMEESGIPSGTAALDLNVIANEELSNSVRNRVLSVVTPLLHSREGEFNFILSDRVSELDIEYSPEVLFKEGGLSPQRLIGTTEGEKLKPLRGLEESLKAGKALLRSSAPTEPPLTPSLHIPLAGIKPAPAQDNVLPFPTPEPAFAPIPDEEPAAAPPPPPPPPPPAAPAQTPQPQARPPQPRDRQASSGQFKVAGGLIEVESPDATYRNVVLFERNPLIRVAARRAFGKAGVKIAQFGSLDDARSAMGDYFRSNSFFVTFLELVDNSVNLMQQLKRKNPRLPVVVIDGEADLRRRHDLLRRGADLYLTKPSPARLVPGLAEEELSLFADELVLFAERAFKQWEQSTGGFGMEAGKKFYEAAEKENVERSFSVLKQLINELSNPNDIGEVSSTILRLTAEYLDRGALFIVGDDEFTGVGGFGVTGGGEEMTARVKALRLPRNEAGVLADVASSGGVHRGKMRKTSANVTMIERLGGLLPTEVVALPIMHVNRPIGILYGDNAEHRAPIEGMTGLEIFLSQAGYAFGNAVLSAEKTRSS